MSTYVRRPLHPHDVKEETSVRKIHIQNLTTLLHVCLLKGDVERATRAWAILVRCREVDWKSRWQWGLAILEASSPVDLLSAGGDSYLATQSGRGTVERWLRSLQLSAKEPDKPAMLHALILHFIKVGKYRSALDELEMYLTSYPYLLCGPLHTYAGMLSFLLAQSESMRHDPASLAAMAGNGQDHADVNARRRRRSSSVKRRNSMRASRSARLLSEVSTTTDATEDSDRTATTGSRDPPNPLMISRAKAHFLKSLELDKADSVAKEFITLIDQRPNDEDSEDEDLLPLQDEEEDKEEKDEDDIDRAEGSDQRDWDSDPDGSGDEV